MKTLTATKTVHAPADRAYQEWTNFERFPTFMDNVDEVNRLDGDRLKWEAEIGGVEREFETVTTIKHPGEKIAWETTSGDLDHKGSVLFRPLSDASCEVTVTMQVEPDSILGSVGSWMGFDERAVERDLNNFAERFNATN